MLGLALLLLLTPSRPEIRVRVSPAVAPCVEAAAKAYSGPGRPRLETGPLRDASADVLVGSSVEVDRVLETGGASGDTDVDVARIPWVLVVAPGQPAPPGGLRGLGMVKDEVAVLAGPEAYEARRALRDLPARRVRAEVARERLARAPLALVPLSLAPKGERLSTDVPPLRVRAAVATPARNEAAGRAFVTFLASRQGQEAFAACGVVP